jgi:uracil-DNA glycosylase
MTPRGPSQPRRKPPVAVPSASAALLPSTLSLASLRTASASCRACTLGQLATQTVFGEGPASAKLVLVGEQPGDEEDRVGRPFVGPAGRLLDGVLKEAAVVRADVYLTNAVKHFKFEPRGKRRLHSKPNVEEMNACHAWLDAELTVLRPKVIVCLGATAAHAVLGRSFSVTRSRGVIVRATLGCAAMATWHPSAVLRAPDSDVRARMRAELVRDLLEASRAADATDVAFRDAPPTT